MPTAFVSLFRSALSPEPHEEPACSLTFLVKSPLTIVEGVQGPGVERHGAIATPLDEIEDILVSHGDGVGVHVPVHSLSARRGSQGAAVVEV